MKMKHKVSVIIPAYNCGKYIHRTVSSLLAQTYERIEIIIVNDGSTDDMLEKLLELTAKHPSVNVITQSNSGVSCARNTGISKATGNYIMFMDADDEVKENWVASAVQAIEQNQADIAVGGYFVADMDTGLEDSRSRFSDGVFGREAFIERIFCHRDILPAVWNKIFRTDIIKEHHLRFDGKYAVGEDLLFLIQYSIYIKRAYVFNEHTYCYFINAGGAMNAHQSGHEFKESWLTEWYSILSAAPLGTQQRAGHRGLVDAQLLRDLGHGLILLKIHPEQLPLPRGQRLLPCQAQVALEPKQLTVVVLRVGTQPRRHVAVKLVVADAIGCTFHRGDSSFRNSVSSARPARSTDGAAPEARQCAA